MNALLRYPGAKWSTADKIIKYFPEHKGYLEPYFGSGAILFNKKQSKIDTINDIDSEVVNFFKVLKNDYKKLQDELKYIPYAREIYLQFKEMKPKNEIEKALRFFIVSWMSHGGYQPYMTGWSNTKKPSYLSKPVLFKNIVDNLKLFHERLREVQIENTDALELIKAHDFKDTLIYLDPPYVLDTRKQYLYKHEMTDSEHIQLLQVILSLKNAYVLLSGYDCDLYNNYLNGWEKATFSTVDGKANVKQEVIWMNYKLNNFQQSLFEE